MRDDVNAASLPMMPRRPLGRRLRPWLLPAAALVAFALALVSILQPARTKAAPPLPPAASGFASSVAAVGIVEPESEPIAVASELPGVVRTVDVVPGQEVAAGSVLFTLDDRALLAARSTARANLQAAQADLVVSQAQVAVAQSAAADAQSRLKLYVSVDDARAVSGDEVDRQRFSAERAQAALVQAGAQVDGARARIAQAQAQVQAIDTDLDRLKVRAPIAGRIWRRNVRAGEFAPAGALPEPLIVIGSDRALQVRVEIDEEDAPRLREAARAEGVFRGASGTRLPLTFVRVEPQVRPKRSLTGAAQRVDSRVLEVLYRFESGQAPTLIGQRMDVFIDAKPLLADAGERK